MWIIPQGRIPRLCDGQPEACQALCRGAKVNATIISGPGHPCGFLENTLVLVVSPTSNRPHFTQTSPCEAELLLA